jgi:glycosyltransferase involved in cell wall biosynthesis
MKVSVIIPVHNTGEELSRCVESVLAQTIDDYEVIFADDGSDDGTEKRLDAIEAAHEHVRVLHLPRSGGPGAPRNAGIDAARGDYVYFLDDDDWLGDEALERMHAMAVRYGSDIVIGKMVGHGRRVPRLMFRADRARADILDGGLLGILTAHKLFRRSFLAEHRLRFPEGPVRLEDHRFVLLAYFRARMISVLGSYPCCHWVKRAGSYSRTPAEPGHFHAVLRDVLGIVDEHVAAGPVRDRYYAHWYRGKILKRLGEHGLLDAPADYRRGYYEESRKLVDERFGPDVDRWLRTRMRVRSELLRADAYDQLFHLLEAERGTALDAVLDGVRWRGDRLAVRFTARLVLRDGTPLTFSAGRWEPPVPVGVSPEACRVDDRSWRLDLYIRRREDGADLPLPISVRPHGDGVMSGEALVDTEALTWLPDGTWDLVARLDGGGWTAERRLAGYAADLPARGRLAPYRTVNGNLSVRVAPAPPEGGRLGRTVRRLSAARRRS